MTGLGFGQPHKIKIGNNTKIQPNKSTNLLVEPTHQFPLNTFVSTIRFYVLALVSVYNSVENPLLIRKNP